MDHGVVAMTVDSEKEGPQFGSHGKPIFNSDFMKFVFRVNGIIKPSWGLRHWWSEFDYRYDRIRICFSILILGTLCEKPMRWRHKALFCWFLFLFFLALYQLNLSCKFKLIIFFLLNFESFKSSSPLFLKIEGKR